MPPSKAERMRHRAIAREWVRFRQKHGFTQVMLAEAMGIARRTVQYAESGKGQDPDWPCIPAIRTLNKFRQLKAKHERDGHISGVITSRDKRLLKEILGLSDLQVEQLQQILPYTIGGVNHGSREDSE